MKQRKQILIVDDDAAIRNLLRLLAERRGFSVDLAVDGVDALDKLAVCSYDLAIIDLMMPRLNGYDLARELIDHEERPTVVIASAMTDELVAKLDARYVHSIIRKPFDVDMVGSLMTEIVAAVAERTTTVVELTDPGPRILGIC